MSLDLGDHTSEISINTNLSEEEYRLLEVSLSICKKDPNQWSIDEWIEALAGALIHRYLINDGSNHPALEYWTNRGWDGLLDQVIEAYQIHQSLKTLLAVQMLLSLVTHFFLITKHREYLTGIVDHNINEWNDWIASVSRDTDILWCDTTGSFFDRLVQDPDRAFVVNLRQLYIAALPQGLSQLRHLKYLDLCGNKELFSNPQSMEQLESLSRVWSISISPGPISHQLLRGSSNFHHSHSSTSETID